MLLLAGVLSSLLGASQEKSTSAIPVTRFGELRFQPGFEARKDSFVSLAPVQSVSFRGVRWTARDFYVKIRKGGKDIDIQWLEPLPGEGKLVVDTAYGPFSWRNGRLAENLSLRASSKSPLLIQLDTAATLSSSLGWLEAREIRLGKDSTVAIEQDSVWLRLRTGASLQSRRILLHGPLRWKGSFPRQKLPPSNSVSSLWLDSLWLKGDTLEAKGIRHCPAQDTCRRYPQAAMSLDYRLLQTGLEADGHWPIGPEVGVSWQGDAQVDGGLPRFSRLPLKMDLSRGKGLSSGWCDSTGVPLLGDSAKLVAGSPGQYVSTRMVHRCDDQGLLWQGSLELRWRGNFQDGGLWTWQFHPVGVGIAGLRDAKGKPVPPFDSTVRDSFQAEGISALLRALPAKGPFKVADRNFPVVTFDPGDSASSLHLVFSDGSRAKILQGRAALACGGSDTLPVPPIPVRLQRSGACLELENPPKALTFANSGAWGTFRPGRIWKMLPFDGGYQIDGMWHAPKAVRERFGTDSLPTQVRTTPTHERFARELPGSDWSSTIRWTLPASWTRSLGFEDLAGSSTFQGYLSGSKMRLSYQAPPDGPRVTKRLVSPNPQSWKGKKVGLVTARFDLSADNRLTDTLLVWSTFERFDRLEHPWGWIYQFAPPASADFVQQGPIELFQEPQRYTRLALPEDGNPNPPAKGLARPNYPPLSPSSESTLPFSSLPPAPERAGRAKISLDSVGDLRVDRLMATVSQYDSCVSAGNCLPIPADTLSDTGSSRVWTSRARWPESVQTGLDFQRAQAYCAYKGAKLPTSIQWRMLLRKDLGVSLEEIEDEKIEEHEYRCAASPQIPGQLIAWPSGLFDLIGNGGIWCRGGKPCGTLDDFLCDSRVPASRTYGVRCVE